MYKRQAEDSAVYNPNGKEIIARDNEISILRKEDLSKAYFSCHTDITTVSYTHLGEVVLATEDGRAGTKGNVIDAIREHGLKADVIFACGPTPMLRALKAYAAEENITCFLSLEEKMACGIGACLACVCKTKNVDEHSQVHNARICKDCLLYTSHPGG